jgi:hypothetical protein
MPASPERGTPSTSQCVQGGVYILVFGNIALVFPSRSAACAELTEMKHPTARILTPGNSFDMVSSCHSECDGEEHAENRVIIP